ncbi:unnamed protein product [Trichobilharzia regenti]|nr:unnamed protein product [Trichobilharzia regenti]
MFIASLADLLIPNDNNNNDNNSCHGVDPNSFLSKNPMHSISQSSCMLSSSTTSSSQGYGVSFTNNSNLMNTSTPPVSCIGLPFTQFSMIPPNVMPSIMTGSVPCCDSHASHLLRLFNDAHTNIEFTMEHESDGKFHFHNIGMERLEDGSLQKSIYRKPTWKERYLHFKRFCANSFKRGLVPPGGITGGGLMCYQSPRIPLPSPPRGLPPGAFMLSPQHQHQQQQQIRPIMSSLLPGNIQQMPSSSTSSDWSKSVVINNQLRQQQQQQLQPPLVIQHSSNDFWSMMSTVPPPPPPSHSLSSSTRPPQGSLQLRQSSFPPTFNPSQIRSQTPSSIGIFNRFAIHKPR